MQFNLLKKFKNRQILTTEPSQKVYSGTASIQYNRALGIASILNIKADNSIWVQSNTSNWEQFGVAHPLAFLKQRQNKIRVCIQPKENLLFRIEVHGFITRFNKAYIDINEDGDLIKQGEEINSCEIIRRTDQLLELIITFTPHQSRLEHLFVFAKINPAKNIGNLRPEFSIQSCAVEYENIDPISPNNAPLVQKTKNNVAFVVQNFSLFRNSYFSKVLYNSRCLG
jgi:hypothetical protein